ncbi:hypothetical protein QQZ08_000736 [Neonectria magnoliae]|uniref:Phosphoribosyltransferase domain-containing protein n=1 Tax=Neonectria magnoliae TaxID=2732573 RepID=A0ABR1IJE4_9HYPO
MPTIGLFGSPLGYSEIAFRQATLLYKEASDDDDFEALCEAVASAVTIRSEFVSLLRLISSHGHTGVVIVTCGLRRIWEKDLRRLGMVESIKVIGSGRVVEAIFGHRRGHSSPISDPEPSSSKLRVFHATGRNVAKLLMTPTRNASVSGPDLRAAHNPVGSYLAQEFLSEMIGVDEYLMPHVQGHETSGYRLSNEARTSIVALMRGGEPMALGVNEAFPLVMFIHAACPADIKPHHVQQQRTLVLVDSVVNSGKTVTEFVQHVRCLSVSIKIVVLAGVVQAKATSEGQYSMEALASQGDVNLVALRLSDNKFTGMRGTDTGNRLFNTTHMC